MSQTRNRRRTSTRSSSGRSRQEYGEKQRRTKKNNEIDIQVYKVNEKEKIYERCSVPTDFLIQINSEYKRAGRLPESKRVIGQKITGLYKIVSGNDYIAFDGEKDKNYIYRGDTKYLYEFDSTMYNLVIEACK